MKIIQLILTILLLSTSLQAAPKAENIDQLADESQKLFYRGDYDASLEKLQKYFAQLEGLSGEKVKLRFFAIVAMGRIYLQHKQDPKGAIEWFKKFKKSQSLTDAEKDIIEGWNAAAKDWIKLGKFPKSTKNEKDLFEIGKKYYDAGIKKQKYPMDPAGTADFSIASSYLVPLLVHYDKNANLGEALFMMGDMRRRLWESNEYWSENYYLTEAIRRFPKTPTAKKAYEALNDDIRFGYSGSGGEHTPRSWVILLDELKKLSEGKTENTTPVEMKPQQ